MLKVALYQQDVLGRTPLHHAAMRSGEKGTVKVQVLPGLFKLAELSVGGQVLAHKGIPPIVTFLENIPKDKFGKTWRDYYSSTMVAKPPPRAKRPPPPPPYGSDGGEATGGWGVAAYDHDPVAPLAPGRCDIAQVVDEPTAENFGPYLAANRPVIFRGGAAHASTFASLRARWRRDALLADAGLRDADLVGGLAPIPFASTFDVQTRGATLGELAEEMSAASAREPPSTDALRASVSDAVARATAANDDGHAAADASFAAMMDAAPRYHFSTDFVRAHAGTNDGLVDDSELRPAFVAGVAGVGDTPFRVALQIGPPGAGAPVQYHKAAIDVLAYGRKRWALLPPPDAIFSIKPVRQWFAHEHAHYAALAEAGNITMLECMQEPGDILFIPDSWGFGALHVQESIGLVHEFDFQPNEVRLRLSVGDGGGGGGGGKGGKSR